MSAACIDLTEVVSEVVRTGVAPSAVASVAYRSEGRWINASAAAGLTDPERGTVATVDAVYDLASITKPVVAVCAAKAVERGHLTWSDPVSRWLPELAAHALGAQTLERLASHRAGLLPHLPIFETLWPAGDDRTSHVLGLASGAYDATAAGTARYSDLGYMLLGYALEAALAKPLAGIVAEWITLPLGVRLIAAAALAEDDNVACTEVATWRGGTVRREVHDENAWVLSGLGLSGHAGLFGSAPEVARFGTALLDVLAGRSTTPVSMASLRWMLSPQHGGSNLVGFDSKSAEGSSAGTLLGPRSFGHLGFTGTSLWIDPDADLVIVLLTNRVYPTRGNVAIRQARPAIADRIVELVRASVS